MCFTAGSQTSISNREASPGDSSTHPALRNALTASTPASKSDSAVTSTECRMPLESVKVTRHKRRGTNAGYQGFRVLFATISASSPPQTAALHQDQSLYYSVSYGEIVLCLTLYVCSAYAHDMGNKTIYFKDDQLWERARELAGKDGISAVIQDALAKFVDGKKREIEGFRTYRLETHFNLDDPQVEATERIAFEGCPLASARMQATVSETEYAGYDAEFTVYRTKGGKLILAADNGQRPHYGVYDSLRELAADPLLTGADPTERANFLGTISKKLAEDWATWID